MPDYYHHLTAPEAEIVAWDIGGYSVRVPRFMAERRGDRSYWERARFQHMERHLKPGMCLFDVGAEQGDISAIYARFAGGGENIVLIEPVPQSWVNIKHIWAANSLSTPRGVWCGFVGDRSWISEYHETPTGSRDGWPECAYDDKLLDATKFKYIGEHAHCTDSTTIDEFVANTGIVPSALTIDVEGYEPTVIAGAMETIRAHRPLIWASLHDSSPNGNNIRLKYMGSDGVDNMHRMLTDAGYAMENISRDHELHVAYLPIDRGV